MSARETAGRLAGKFHVSLETSAGVIAALSPGRNWTENIYDAETFLAEYSKGARGRYLPAVGTYGGKNLRKAERIAAGADPLDVLGGPKVRAFYRCIVNPESREDVCIDRHSKCAAYGVKTAENSLVKLSEYDHIADHYRRCARQVGVLPNQFQAVVWVTWRRLSGVLAQQDLEFDAVPF
jgi:hypothetical protein